MTPLERMQQRLGELGHEVGQTASEHGPALRIGDRVLWVEVVDGIECYRWEPGRLDPIGSVDDEMAPEIVAVYLDNLRDRTENPEPARGDAWQLLSPSHPWAVLVDQRCPAPPPVAPGLSGHSPPQDALAADPAADAAAATATTGRQQR